MNFANSLEPDQDRHYVGPSLDPNRLTLWQWYWMIFLEKVIFEKKSPDGIQSMQKYRKC